MPPALGIVDLSLPYVLPRLSRPRGLILSGVLAVMAALWLLPRMRVRAKSEVADEEKTRCVTSHVQLGARCTRHWCVRSGLKPNISSVGPISLSPTTST
jgi:hypothetical protein